MLPTRNMLEGIRALARTPHGPTASCPWGDKYFAAMANLYVAQGRKRETAVEFWFARGAPGNRTDGKDNSAYLLLGGLWRFLQTLQDWQPTSEVSRIMRAAGVGDPLITYLQQQGKFKVQILAPPPGSIFVPHEPVITVRGPLPMVCLAEGILIGSCNAPTQQMTVARRVVEASLPTAVLDFTYRKAEDSFLTALYCHLAGIRYTSNDRLLDYFVMATKGTMAHKFIQSFGRDQLWRCDVYRQYFDDPREFKEWVRLNGGELAGFDAWVEIHPEKPILLIDTISTMQVGIRNAILVLTHHRERIRKAGGTPGVRLDSGRFGWLIPAVAKELNAAGLGAAIIVVSGGLDEFGITNIKDEIRQTTAARFGLNAENLLKRVVWAVGEKLATCWHAPAFRGAVKLTETNGVATIKISDDPGKSSIPGDNRSAWIFIKGKLERVLVYQARNYRVEGEKLIDASGNMVKRLTVFDKDDPGKRTTIPPGYVAVPRQVEVFNSIDGPGIIFDNVGSQTLDGIVSYVETQMGLLDPSSRLVRNPYPLPLSLTLELSQLRQRMLQQRVLHESMLDPQ